MTPAPSGARSSSSSRAIGTEPQRAEAQRHAATLEGVARLTDVDAAVARGRALTLEEAATLARDVLSGALE